MSSARIRIQLRSSLWLVPLLGLLAGIGLSFVLIGIDRAGDYKLVSQSLVGSPSAVQQLLSTAAASLVSLTSLVLSLTLVAIQLAMGQFSPRIVRALLNDRRSQFAIALFLATFAHTMLTLKDVNDQTGNVPGVAVLVAYVLTLLSVVGLVLYVHHAGQSLRVAGMVDLVGDTTRAQLERLYPEPLEGAPEEVRDDGHTIPARKSGDVIHIDHAALVALARETDCMLELMPRMGDFVFRETPLFRVHGAPASALDEKARRLVVLGRERTHEEDPAYGIRKLVDIAERSIATPFDDPTTAVQSIHRLHECLRQIAGRRFPTGRHCDADGHVRLTTRELDWGGYVRLAFDEVRLAGSGVPQVTRRLRAAIEDLKQVAPPERHPPLDRQLELLEAGVRRSLEDDADIEAALVPDKQGVGSGSDVLAAGANGSGGNSSEHPGVEHARR